MKTGLNKKVPVVVTLLGMGLLSGQGAMAAPVNFNAGIAKVEAACAFTVAQTGNTQGTATYMKGKDEEPGQLTIVNGEPSTVTITASGGRSCVLPNLRAKTEYTGANKIAGDGGVYGIPTRSGTGYFPVNFALSNVSATSRDEGATPILTVTASNGRAINPINYSYTNLQEQKVTDSTRFARFHEVENRVKLPLKWSGTVIGQAAYSPITLTNGYSHWTLLNEVQRSVGFLPGGNGLTSVSFAVKPLFGLGPYNSTTHVLDDSTLAEGEELSATAVMTITAV
ncbi:hypothetical protein EC835_1195 [Providencia alcalifaciens]|uniref:Fimbrial protein n=1 Tax=Providencia alcalifaciens TaxID=126385 RepID=A0A4R3NCK8_9GAMM|nr:MULTISPECIES: hypothetical protein [Providencia]MBC5792269.1 hypothetical protein [Providencia sp. JUb39]TCT28166.1 hypothetical protein EC835_1195 [Providencia alcalifaciens]